VLLTLPGEAIELFTSESGALPRTFSTGQKVTDTPGLPGLSFDLAMFFA
jgi:hypothetical protein